MELDELKKKLSAKNEKLIASIVDKLSNKKLTFLVSNEMTFFRVKSLFSKEPITIEWIRSFENNSIFYDVGANVGMYSIFAAIVSQSKVFSFEPEANNFQTLMENLILNNLSDRVIPYPIGISDETSFTTLHMNIFDKGSSHHTVGDSLDHNLSKIKTKYKQGIFSTSLDDLCNNWELPLPNYLKIDVDGIEFKIISKSKKLLSDKKLKSVLIEINPHREEDKSILKIMDDFNFSYSDKQVDAATRKSGPHKGYAEYLFYRK